MEERIGLYPQRPSGIELEYQSEVDLTPEEKRGILDFERALYHSGISGPDYPLATGILLKNEVPELEEVWQIPDDKVGFYPRYFLTEKGESLLRRTLGDIPNSALNSEVFLTIYLAGRDWKEVPMAKFEELGGSSLRYTRSYVAGQFARWNFERADTVDLPSSLYIIYDPDKLLTKIESLRKVKAYYRAVWRDLRKQEANPETAGKLGIAELYLKKTNWLLAELLPDALEFSNQADASGRADLQELSSRMKELLPVKQRKSFGRVPERYDRFRNGIMVHPDTGNYSVVNPQLENLSESNTLEQTKGYFNEQEIAELGEIEVDAEEAKDWLEVLLAEHDLLSEDTEVDLQRPGRASDGKWQVILTDKVTSISVNGRQGFVKVPTSYKRNAVRSAALICHEFGHVVQHENKARHLDLELAQNIGADRASVMFEAGGLWYEELAKQELFGDSRPAKRHFLQAVKTRVAGGSFLDSWKAYFDSAMEADPENPQKKAEIAFSNTRRLFRKGGAFTGAGMVSDSQPLHYLEQSLIARSLNDEEKKILLLGGINIPTLNELTRIGLTEPRVLIKSIWAPAPWNGLRAIIEEKLRENAK